MDEIRRIKAGIKQLQNQKDKLNYEIDLLKLQWKYIQRQCPHDNWDVVGVSIIKCCDCGYVTADPNDGGRTGFFV